MATVEQAIATFERTIELKTGASVADGTKVDAELLAWIREACAAA